MLDLVDGLHFLEFRIFETDLRQKASLMVTYT